LLSVILLLGCHFLCQVKRNCRKLWEVCALHTALARPISIFEYYEAKNGNEIHRNVALFENEATLPKGWEGISRIVKVRRWGVRNTKAFDETSYYILSKPIHHARTVAKAIQGHWSIENGLHWTKDMHLGEDDMTLKDKQQVTLLTYLNNVAVNLIKAKGWKPNADTFAKIKNKVYELGKLFN
jgi:predicted transposase YbfD/YdcC